jgi:hypothetical protein
VDVKTFVTCMGAAFLAMANPRWSTAQVHLVGVMPTVDVGMPLGEHWFIENYSFACILPVEQIRPSLSNAAVMERYGPGVEPGESRAIRSLVFAYTECDVTRTLNDRWSLTGSYTHEWVPMNSGVWGGGERYVRDEHRLWLQSKYQSPQTSAMSWWWRMRWDQRWIENSPFGEKSWSVRPRLRQQLGGVLQMGDGSLVVSSEVFLEAWDGAGATAPRDRFREAWTTLQYGASINESVRWEAGPLVVSWKQLDEGGSLGWTHFWYLQASAFVKILR